MANEISTQTINIDKQFNLDNKGERDNITFDVSVKPGSSEVKITGYTSLSGVDGFKKNDETLKFLKPIQSVRATWQGSASTALAKLKIDVTYQDGTQASQSESFDNLLPEQSAPENETHISASDQAKIKADKERLDKEIRENAGVLGALRDDSALDSVLGSTGLNADSMTGIGGLIGNKATQIGSGGLGARGLDLGSGGTAEGLSGLGMKGRGSGASGYGSGNGNFGSMGSGGLSGVGESNPSILEALDNSLIDAVIKRNMSQIRYCYQNELRKNPTLAGKITIEFTIARDGTVSSAETIENTMKKKDGDAGDTVGKNIAGRFLRFQFPEPKGGGIVIVRYPFVFAP